ncbi:hypothetical protein NA57DRAFT_34518 [Rhizodiscina lignyota]|uniref:Uncharacterized protein n=1 Tax=Rhizodiscina lignyota TaxID=1504668 RepID=A0A9P4M9I4_9PEZI|nr:hypothetical protein NA57DRAFT_34518 [Rhizodiscina lignyota]
MPVSLLPASAAAFAPRTTPNVVLNSKVEPWLTQTLKRINRIKRPLNSVPQHFRCLTETLSSERAIWTLCSIMLPKAPDSELTRDTNPLVEALFNYQLLHIEAYVVHVDMVSQHEVAFKLTQDTIDSLIEYHKDIYSIDVSASTWPWAEKEVQLKKLQEEFVQAVNRYVFRTGVRALEGLEEDGAGELLDGRSEDVKNAIMGLFLPLLPPPPRIVDVVRPQALLPSSPAGGHFWHPSQHIAPPHPQPVESWKVLPSTPSPTLASCTSESQPTFWSTMGLNDQLPSPTPSYSQPFTTSQYYSPPQPTAAVVSMPMSHSLIAQQCGTAVSGPGFGPFDWSNNNFAPTYATAI